MTEEELESYSWFHSNLPYSSADKPMLFIDNFLTRR